MDKRKEGLGQMVDQIRKLVGPFSFVGSWVWGFKIKHQRKVPAFPSCVALFVGPG